MNNQPLYKIFYINKEKLFLTRSWLTNNPKTSITNKHPTFKEDVGWFNAQEICKIIKQSSIYEVWGICDVNGKQYVKPKWQTWNIKFDEQGKIKLI